MKKEQKEWWRPGIDSKRGGEEGEKKGRKI